MQRKQEYAAHHQKQHTPPDLRAQWLKEDVVYAAASWMAEQEVDAASKMGNVKYCHTHTRTRTHAHLQLGMQDGRELHIELPVEHKAYGTEGKVRLAVCYLTHDA